MVNDAVISSSLVGWAEFGLIRRNDKWFLGYCFLGYGLDPRLPVVTGDNPAHSQTN